MRTFLQILILSTTLLSSVFLIKGSLVSSPADIVEMAVPKFDYNLDIAKHLCRERADTTVGFWLLLFSFSLQMINIVWPMQWIDSNISKTGIFIAIIVAISIFFISYYTSNLLYKTGYAQIKKALIEKK